MSKKIFITGTDTDVGKTYVTLKLLQHYQQQGLNAFGLKPVAAGCKRTDDGLRNGDAELIRAVMKDELPYDMVNSFAYEEPLAPNILAQNQLSAQNVIDSVAWIEQSSADVILIEGAGGWLLPLNTKETMADVVRAMDLSVILVVGLRLGCLNHTLLTYNSVKSMNVKFEGWIANEIDPNMRAKQENIDTITAMLGQEPLYRYPYA